MTSLAYRNTFDSGMQAPSHACRSDGMQSDLTPRRAGMEAKGCRQRMRAWSHCFNQERIVFALTVCEFAPKT
ncbi:hypothetical protein ACVILH_003857 [Bradyrhizobium sp. USDA 4353]